MSQKVAPEENYIKKGPKVILKKGWISYVTLRTRKKSQGYQEGYRKGIVDTRA